jgi:adenylate kinase family enzyme
MSFFIILRGPLGIGKTTIAEKLSKKLKAKHISIDKILEENNLDREDNNFIPEDFIKADNIILADVKKDLSNGKIVIFDGCFYFKEQIEHLEKSLKPFKGFIFNLKSPLETCIIRDSKRKRVYGEQAAREVYELVSKFDYGIKIDTEGKTANSVVKEILDKLK